MNYPIIQVKTSDDLWLHGLYLPAARKETLFVNIHGTASNFYEEDFIETMADRFVSDDISMLSTNNRGTGTFNAWDHRTGAAVEFFEECLLDIDAWLKFALSEGFSKIVLSGHSLGTEKVVYYMGKGTYKDKINLLVLLAPADSARWRYYDKTYKVPVTGETGREREELQIKVAKEMIAKGKGDELMDRTSYAGAMPKTPKSLLNFRGEGIELLKALPFHLGKLEMYGKIDVPILVVIGDKREYTGIPITDALEMMVKENPRTETHQLKNCDHDFDGKEEELAKLMLDFIKKNIK